jgi:hypothetical protein
MGNNQLIDKAIIEHNSDLNIEYSAFDVFPKQLICQVDMLNGEIFYGSYLFSLNKGDKMFIREMTLKADLNKNFLEDILKLNEKIAQKFLCSEILTTTNERNKNIYKENNYTLQEGDYATKRLN